MSNRVQLATLFDLPSRRYEQSPRRLREQFLSGEIDREEFLKKNAYHIPRTHDARFTNQVHTYATASIVIDQFWEFLQTQPVSEILKVFRSRSQAENRLERIIDFSRCCNGTLGALQEHFLDKDRKRDKTKEWSVESELRICFFAVARWRWRKLGKGLPFPSMKDLVTMTARMAQVADEVFLHDVGHTALPSDIVSLLRQPQTLRFFIEMMSNDRLSMYPFFALLEGKDKPNLNESERLFEAKHFEVCDLGQGLTLRIKPSIIETYRQHFVKAERRQKRRNKKPITVLGCPALYTGKIREMYTWTLDELELWL